MTQRVSADFAQNWGTAHECDKTGKLQEDDTSNRAQAATSKMDLYNNSIGRSFGLANPKGNCTDMCNADAHDRDHELTWIKGPDPWDLRL